MATSIATTSSNRSVSVRDVSAPEFIATYAKFLKKSGKLTLPKWVDLVKTATWKELPPMNPDWYYIRAAAIARKVYLQGGKGIKGFQRAFGGSAKPTVRPAHFGVSSGAVIRHVVHQLEKVQVIKKDEKGGRVITNVGHRDLDRIASQIVNKKAKKVSAKKPATKTTGKK